LIHLPAEGKTFAPFLLCSLSAAAEELNFSFHPPWQKIFFFSRKGAETQRGILCVLASLRELIFFERSARRKSI
jgi:hypothetical protein